MTNEAYKKYWSDNNKLLYTYSPSNIDKSKLDQNTFDFLTTLGLPSDAAPFLSFREVRDNTLLTPNQYFDLDFEILDDYLMFGSNGSGDPVCIDTANQNEIVYLNHDNDFQRIFMNKSILQFALCLIKYRNFIRSLSSPKIDDFKRRKFSDEEFENLKSDFISIDKDCLSDNACWFSDLDYLKWERDNK